MKYKMLVVDMDDTLLTDDHEISIENATMLLKAQEMGVYVVLASGRPTSAMLAYAKELQCDINNSYMISFNGSTITDLKADEIIFEQKLTKEQIHSLYDFSQQNNTHIITYLDGKIISESNSEYIDIERDITGLELIIVPNFKEAVTTSAVKCLLLEEPSFLKGVESVLKAAMPDLSVCMSKPFFLEAAPNGVDKGAAIQILAKKLNIHQSEIIAVGNAGNDLTMVQYAGLGVWVDNVDAELREFGDVIVASNNNHGVAEVVRRFILN
ncbi:Cof-type HAD-IIB family hydrolase [Flavobacterium soyangense]|uniref:Cof-type HAD-IIB family hydrolase n=1 Tax=Flavobacterium soyangense TaxID=2023265 RepID=A0A930UC19_9FLAO|nr:Cof-type HAD-IIB family hydrolase [Flavobacterium soyangense]MBF2708639.1 Cof-type HAD-IIB family hydrolase [Flavobacterium soyangense]